MENYDELERMRARRRQAQNTRPSGQRGKGRRPSSYDDDTFDIIDLENFDYTSMRTEGSASKKHSGKHTDRHPQKKKTGKQKRKKKGFLIAKIGILALLIFFASVFIKDKMTGRYWTVAIFGVDSRDGNLEKGALSDVEMLCTVDKKTGEMKLVSVYRDTYLQIDEDGTYHKINEAYFKGGHKQAISALERNLDLEIDNYATFNWKAVADTINILGGIDVEITQSEFNYINGFITETVESTGIGSVHLQSPGMNHLDGVQAVAYARLRLMDTDYNRTARQRKVISLALEKAKQADFSVLNNILVTVLPQISTDVGVSDLLPMAKDIGKYYLGTTDGFPFSRGEAKIEKRSCVIPLTLESNVIQLHELLYGEENYQPSSTVKKISSHIAEVSGMGEVAENAPKATVGGDGSSGGSNSGSNNSSGSSGNAPAAPAETQAPETVPEETTSAEETSSSTESSEEETTIEESVPESTTAEEDEREDNDEDNDEEVGPGVDLPVEKPDDNSGNTGNSGNSGIIGPGSDASETKPVKPQPPALSDPDTKQSGPGELVGPGV